MELNSIDLNKLNTFLVVAEQGSMANASKKLLLTRSAISQSVSSLEASLGAKLFHRIGKRLVLTGSGQRLSEELANYHRSLRSALSGLATRERQIQGIVRLGLFIGFPRPKLIDLLAELLREFPRLQMKLLFVSQPELGSLLTENKIDFALSVYPLQKESRSVISSRLFDEELVLVSGRKLLPHRPDAESFRGMPVIDYFQNGQLFKEWSRHHFGKEIPVNIRAFGAAIDYVLELILKDVGVGVVPRYVAEPYLERRELFQVRSGRPELRDSIWLNKIRGFRYEPVAELLYTRIKEKFS